MQSTAAAKGGRSRRSVWTIIAVLAAFIVVALGGSTIIGRIRENQTTFQSQTEDIVPAFVGDLSSSATASGQIEARQKTVLAANRPGLIKEVFVNVGALVQEGDKLAQVDTRDLALGVERAGQNLALNEANLEALLSTPNDADVAAAEAAVYSAQVRLDDLLAGPDTLDIAESEAGIRAQQANLASAYSSYNRTSESISDSAIAAAELDLINAQIVYDQAKRTNESFPIASTHEALEDAAEKLAISQAELDEIKSGPNQGSLSSASAGISAAAANLDQVEANHEALIVGSSAAQIADAESTLAQAEAILASLTAPPLFEDIIIAEAQIEQAQLALIDAQELVTKATIQAPFDGLITAVHVAAGEYANSNVVEIVSSDLVVVLRVDEIDVGSLVSGQPAIITMETWPNVEIYGEIGSIAPSASSNGNGLVTYDVRITLEETELPVLVGMTANARLITSNIEDVLLVPNAAITANRAAGTYTVNLVTGQADESPITERVEVIIGLKDGEFTQIVDGLSNGDKVAIGELSAPTQSFGPGGRDGPFGFD
jgi:HlyD family secretion protein